MLSSSTIATARRTVEFSESSSRFSTSSRNSSCSSSSSSKSSSTNAPEFDENTFDGGICRLSPTTIPAFPRPRAPTAWAVRTCEASSKTTTSKSMDPTGTRVATESGLIRKHGIASAKALPYFEMRSRIGVLSPLTGFRPARSELVAPMSLPVGVFLRA